MATVFNPATEERVLLRVYHVFRRNELRADTRIASADVSSLHAVVRWRAQAWAIADFSRNGTFEEGEALPPGQWRPLREGQLLRFGSSPRSVWQVCDLSPPATSLVPLDPQGGADAAVHCPLHLVFDVSADEEHIRLQLRHGSRSIELGERRGERRRGGLRLGELSFEIRQGSHLRDRYRPVPAASRLELAARPPVACT